jgi:hypothetical protein
MTPTNEALQVFYGTIPLILIVAAAWMRESMLLKDILSRLGRIEDRLGGVEARLTGVEKKVEALEIKAWR